jgi:hypothetical protein
MITIRRLAAAIAALLAAAAVALAVIPSPASAANGCGRPRLSSGRVSLDRWARTHNATVSETMYFTVLCSAPMQPRLARYLDHGQLHRVMSAGIRLWTSSGV